MILRALLILAIIAVLFGGCTHKTTVLIPMPKEETKEETMPIHLLTDIVMPIPPSIHDFKYRDVTGRMELLSDYMKELMKTIKLHEVRFNEIRKWQEEHR